MVAECLENLEEHRGQDMNEEVIRNVAGMVYLGELVLRHTAEIDLNISIQQRPNPFVSAGS